MALKEVWKKFWHLLWKDDSLKGWIFSLIFLFVFIKFIFFPVLSLITGTSLPLAIVESCSMYHKHNLFYSFNDWYSAHDSKYSEYIINNLDFERYPFRNGLNKGDIILLTKANPEKIKIGDIIAFDAGQSNPVIHRVIKINKFDSSYTFSTIGDNNNGQLGVEKEIKEDQIVGKVVFEVVPLMGWGKLVFFKDKLSEGLCKENNI